MGTAARLSGYILLLVAAGLLVGCWRPSPPEMRKFRKPAKAVVQEVAPPAAADTGPLEAVEPKPEPPPPEPVRPAPPVQRPPPEPNPAPQAEATPSASIVGSWRVTEMSHNGQTIDMPGGMQMIYTFTDSGTVSMSVSGENLPQGHSQEGAYTLSDNQITISLRGQSKTGTYKLEGTDRLILEMDGARIVLTRS